MEVSRPSNIALIKYMGKIPGAAKNTPTNSSLSWTLESLRTFVDIEPISSEEDQWQPLSRRGIQPFGLTDKGKSRYLTFWKLLKEELGIDGEFMIRSGNNFPADCGLASSASSFAALTQAAYEVAQTEHKGLLKLDAELAQLSRQGSGSSCRSFFSPWCVWWNDNRVEKIDFPYFKLRHYVVIISDEKKSVSSSDAHVKVSSSPGFRDRPQRAEERLHKLINSLKHGNWDLARNEVWEEFMDMHALFHTSQPSFTYFSNDVKKALEFLKDVRSVKKDSPLVTMDAGPNIHLLFNEEQRKLEESVINDLKRNYKCISSEEIDV